MTKWTETTLFLDHLDLTGNEPELKALDTIDQINAVDLSGNPRMTNFSCLKNIFHYEGTRTLYLDGVTHFGDKELEAVTYMKIWGIFLRNTSVTAKGLAKYLKDGNAGNRVLQFSDMSDAELEILKPGINSSHTKFLEICVGAKGVKPSIAALMRLKDETIILTLNLVDFNFTPTEEKFIKEGYGDIRVKFINGVKTKY